MWPTKYIPFPVKPRVSRRFYLTTQPYPVEVLETMKSVHVSIGGYKTFKAADTYDSGASVLSGTLVVRLKSHTQPFEEYESEATVLSGTLVTRLKSHTQPPEEYESEAVILSGTLLRIRVDYPHWPLQVADESHESTAAILSGTLTP
jgi:hypothetical protein